MTFYPYDKLVTTLSMLDEEDQELLIRDATKARNKRQDIPKKELNALDKERSKLLAGTQFEVPFTISGTLKVSTAPDFINEDDYYCSTSVDARIQKLDLPLTGEAAKWTREALEDVFMHGDFYSGLKPVTQAERESARNIKAFFRKVRQVARKFKWDYELFRENFTSY